MEKNTGKAKTLYCLSWHLGSQNLVEWLQEKLEIQNCLSATSISTRSKIVKIVSEEGLDPFCPCARVRALYVSKSMGKNT
jgi:hypothetical protein